jgi:O-antigen/teichoic acid export membrane protein
MYRYGRHVSRAIAADYVVSQIDRALVGRMAGAASLGLYAFAARLASLPSTAAYKAVLGVGFPMFARLQSEPERLRAATLRAVGLMTLLAAPISAGLCVVAADMVPLVFGARWEGMIPALRILSAAGTFMALYQLLGAILRGIGLPDRSARGAFVLLAVMVVFLYPAIRIAGIAGASWTMLLGYSAAAAIMGWTTARAIGCGFRDMARMMAPPVAAALVMAGALATARGWLPVDHAWAVLVTQVLAGALVYVAMALSLDRLLGSGIMRSVRSLVGA